MKKILIEFLEIYKVEGLRQSQRGECVGFCSISQKLSPYRNKRFHKYLRAWVKEMGQTTFYTWDNEETSQQVQFIWNSLDYKSRLEWLEKHIELTK